MRPRESKDPNGQSMALAQTAGSSVRFLCASAGRNLQHDRRQSFVTRLSAGDKPSAKALSETEPAFTAGLNFSLLLLAGL